MTSVVIPVNPFDLVIFGATGDLAMRKLLPALFRRHAVAQIPDDARIIGLSLSKHTTKDYRALATKAKEVHDARPTTSNHGLNFRTHSRDLRPL